MQISSLSCKGILQGAIVSNKVAQASRNAAAFDVPLVPALPPIITYATGAFANMCFDGKYVYGLGLTSNILSRIDVRTGALVATIAMPCYGLPNTIVYDDYSKCIWVGMYNLTTLLKVDTESFSVQATFTIASYLMHLCVDETNVFAVGSTISVNQFLFKINKLTGAFAAVCLGSLAGTTIYNEGFIWVGSRYTKGSSNFWLNKIDVPTMAIVTAWTLSITAAPVMCYDGRLLWVTSGVGGGVWVGSRKIVQWS